MNTEVEMKSEAGSKHAAAGKYLTFNLGNESCGIPVLKVREIIKFLPPTVVPQLPGYIKGVVNLRGKIIPVVDFRLKFGMDAATATDHTCIIVVQVRSTARPSVAMGIVVDSVDEVSNLTSNDIEDTPDFGTAIDSACLVGMAKLKNRVVCLLDIDQILGGAALPSGGIPELPERAALAE